MGFTIRVINKDNGKENGNYYNRLYRNISGLASTATTSQQHMQTFCASPPGTRFDSTTV